MLQIASRTPRPEDPMSASRDPALRRYQQAQQWLQLRDPAIASELARTAGTVGLMAQRRHARPLMFGRRYPMRGLGFIMSPAVPPGSSYVDVAWTGVPVWVAPGRRWRGYG
jgi:hypothetical protein